MLAKGILKSGVLLVSVGMLSLSFPSLGYSVVLEDKEKLGEETPLYAPGEVLVKFREGVIPERVLEEVGLETATLERIHSLKPVVARFKKELNLKREEDGEYSFRGKKYKSLEDIPEEELFAAAYQEMGLIERGLYRSYKLILPEGVNVEAGIVILKKHPQIEYAQPNYLMEIQGGIASP